MLNITYITYQQIDKIKWDKCIKNAVNHLVYAESWYLDCVCPKNWNALILNDYEAVMPLPLKSKMSLTYIQQPLWTQQLGVFSTQKLSQEIVEKFINAIPKKMAMVSCNLNEQNLFKDNNLTPKTNLVLNLNTNFKQLQSNFSTNTKRNCNKAALQNLSLHFNTTNVKEYMNFIQQHAPHALSNIHTLTLSKLVTQTIIKQKGFIILAKQDNKIVATAFILKSANRLIYRTGTSNQQGKKIKAMFLLLKTLIQQYADTNYTLDFEGSAIAGVARFYKGFGAKDKPYYYYKKYNNKLLKIIKKASKN